MNLLLLSRHLGALPSFLDLHARPNHEAPRVGYLSNAQAAFADAPFARVERAEVEEIAGGVVDIRARELTPDQFAAALDVVDAVYVAGGSTFALLEALRLPENDQVLAHRVRAGLPYVGSSAGSIVAGPDIKPASLMDDPADAPTLRTTRGLALVDQVVIPHADGLLRPYPPELIAQTIRVYGDDYPLIPLRDDQALLVDSLGARVVGSGARHD